MEPGAALTSVAGCGSSDCWTSEGSTGVSACIDGALSGGARSRSNSSIVEEGLPRFDPIGRVSAGASICVLRTTAWKKIDRTIDAPRIRRSLLRLRVRPTATSCVNVGFPFRSVECGGPVPTGLSATGPARVASHRPSLLASSGIRQDGRTAKTNGACPGAVGSGNAPG